MIDNLTGSGALADGVERRPVQANLQRAAVPNRGIGGCHGRSPFSEGGIGRLRRSLMEIATRNQSKSLALIADTQSRLGLRTGRAPRPCIDPGLRPGA